MSKTIASKHFSAGERFAFHVCLQWKPQDIWIGVYKAERGSYYVCLLPTLPVHIRWVFL